MGKISLYQVWTEGNKWHSAWGNVFKELCLLQLLPRGFPCWSPALWSRLSHQIVQMCFPPPVPLPEEAWGLWAQMSSDSQALPRISQWVSYLHLEDRRWVRDVPFGDVLEWFSESNWWWRERGRAGQREEVNCGEVAALKGASLQGYVQLARFFKVDLDQGSRRSLKSASHCLGDAPEKEVLPSAKWLSLPSFAICQTGK